MPMVRTLWPAVGSTSRARGASPPSISIAKGKRDWLALGRPTIADVSCFGPISMLKVSGYDTDRWPNVTRWLERCKELPGAHDIDGNAFPR